MRPTPLAAASYKHIWKLKMVFQPGDKVFLKESNQNFLGFYLGTSMWTVLFCTDMQANTYRIYNLGVEMEISGDCLQIV